MLNGIISRHVLASIGVQLIGISMPVRPGPPSPRAKGSAEPQVREISGGREYYFLRVPEKAAVMPSPTSSVPLT
jgi:hypothetical protein